jgi:hypothetical protein
MGAISGKYGEAHADSCNFLEFESWELTYGPNVEPINSRAGGGATTTIDGVANGSGTISLFLDPDDPIAGQVTPGQLLTLICMNRSAGAVQATGQARLGQFTLGANRDGSPQRVSIPFTTHGLWTLPGEA